MFKAIRSALVTLTHPDQTQRDADYEARLAEIWDRLHLLRDGYDSITERLNNAAAERKSLAAIAESTAYLAKAEADKRQRSGHPLL